MSSFRRASKYSLIAYHSTYANEAPQGRTMRDQLEIYCRKHIGTESKKPWFLEYDKLHYTYKLESTFCFRDNEKFVLNLELNCWLVESVANSRPITNVL